MNVLEFRHFEPNLKKLIQAGSHKTISIVRNDVDSKLSIDDQFEEEAKLGKRDLVRSVDEIMSEFKNIEYIKEFIIERQKEELQEELHYMREYRIKTELWKKFMVRRNPAKVSFVVHNIDYIADRYPFVTPECFR